MNDRTIEKIGNLTLATFLVCSAIIMGLITLAATGAGLFGLFTLGVWVFA